MIPFLFVVNKNVTFFSEYDIYVKINVPLKGAHGGGGPFNIKSLHVKWQRGGHLAKSGSYLSVFRRTTYIGCQQREWKRNIKRMQCYDHCKLNSSKVHFHPALKECMSILYNDLCSEL